MRKLILRIRIAWLDASIMNALQDLNDLRIRRDAALARLEEVKYRESRRTTVRTINELAARASREPRPPSCRIVRKRLAADDVAVLAPGQPRTDQH
jgi:hypothetical protein